MATACALWPAVGWRTWARPSKSPKPASLTSQVLRSPAPIKGAITSTRDVRSCRRGATTLSTVLKGPECFRSILSNERRQTVFSRIEFWGLAHRRTMTVKPQNSMDECPNITGYFSNNGDGRFENSRGSFTNNASVTPSHSGSNANEGRGFDFSASKSSSLYGQSSTVNPPAMSALVLIKF